MPKKKLTVTKIKFDLWKLVSASIKKRDNYTCWRCGKRYDGSSLHASHILPKGEYPKYEFCSWNLKSLCMHCHLQWWHKNPISAYPWLQQQFPSVFTKCVEMSHPDAYSSFPKQTPDELLLLKLKLENIKF